MPAVFAMTIRLPVDLKERLEAAAGPRGQTAFIIQAIEEKLKREARP